MPGSEPEVWEDEDYSYNPEDEDHCIHQLDDYLFQGDWDSTDASVINYHNIHAIIIVTEEAYQPSKTTFLESNGIEVLHIPVLDVYAAKNRIRQFFDQTADFIHHHISKERNVLVHCHAGMSRSSTISISYFMKYHGLTMEDARYKVRSKRKVCLPNPGFSEALKTWEFILKRRATEKAQQATVNSQ